MTKRKSWTDEEVARDLRAVATDLGHFPSATELRELGRNDLCCAATRSGGLISWAEKLGLQRQGSDSDTGWDGESLVIEVFAEAGIKSVDTDAVKAPFDLLVADVLKVDVKAATYKEYPCGKNSCCRGWFYRLGKPVQADLVVLVQLDTRDFYAVPWWICPQGNITISPDGGKYADYKNNWDIIRDMIDTRVSERQRWAVGNLSPISELQAA